MSPLEFGNGNLLLIPWVRFLYAVLEAGVLTLALQHHEVTIEGKSLEIGADAIGDETLKAVREMPSAYLPLADEGVFVTRIAAENVDRRHPDRTVHLIWRGRVECTVLY